MEENKEYIYMYCEAQTGEEDWYGDYYAWGELDPNKKKYDWDNYKFGNYNKLTKYCNNSKFGLNGFTDNLT